MGRARGARARIGACLVVAGVGVAACQKDPVITTREVTLHAPQACAPGLSNLNAGAFAVYHALGDYEPGAPADGHLLMVGTALPEIDPAARTLLVDTTEQDREWEGVSPLAPTGDVDVLLLPSTTPCALRGTVSQGAGSALGITGGQRALLVGASGSMMLRLDTGALDPLAAGPLGARTSAAVTSFGTGALVAGGIGPGGVAADAAVYDPVQGAFERQTIALSAPRYAAGAAVLATGETVLVGGLGNDRKTALDSIEIVDPVTRKARVAAPRLAAARSAATVLRLASGEIFVAGGVDSSDTPVKKLEWFSPDVSQAITSRTEDLVAGSATYAALEGGGVLAVIPPPTKPPPANPPGTFQNTWVIDPDGAREPATAVEGSLPQPVLFGGAGGAPVLWTGTTAGGAPGRWLRWQPWAGAFAPLEVLDDTPDRAMGVAASPDPGTALWAETGATPRFAALRFDVRGPYSTLQGPLLVADTTDTVPDRFPASGAIAFDAVAGGLTLAPAASPPGATAFVSDRTYADVRVEVDAPTGKPALVVLRDALGHEAEVGGAACPGAVVTGAASTLTVERKGASVTWTVSNGASGKCALGFDARARVSVGVRAAPDLTSSVVRNLRVTRLGSP